MDIKNYKQFSEIDLYPVTGRALFAGRSDEEVIGQLAAGGAKIVQLREKNISDREFFALATLYRRETERHNMLLIINDRPDVALLCGADGVHLGRDDLPVPEVRKLLGHGAIIGASSHSVAQAIEAEKLGATYVNVGPLFPTPTKPDAVIIGLEPLREAVAKVNIPVTTMGGIALDNIGDVLGAGVRHVGVITAVFGQPDIAAATRELVDRIRHYRGGGPA